MNKKLLAILGILAIAGYVFRKQLKSGAQALDSRLQAFVEDKTESLEGLKADILARADELRNNPESGIRRGRPVRIDEES